MRIVIVGGHGQIALLLARQLAEQGHEPVNVIRSPAQFGDVEAAGGRPAIFNIESGTATELAAHLDAADGVVFAAGAGPNSTAERKLTVDRDGATLLVAAAKLAGVGRYVMVSAIATDDFDPDSDEIYQVYLRAKSEADASLRASGLEWTIVRPGRLTNGAPIGKVTVAAKTGPGTVPRADVAAAVLACFEQPRTIGQQFELITGDTPIAEALAAL